MFDQVSLSCQANRLASLGVDLQWLERRTELPLHSSSTTTHTVYQHPTMEGVRGGERPASRQGRDALHGTAHNNKPMGELCHPIQSNPIQSTALPEGG